MTSEFIEAMRHLGHEARPEQVSMVAEMDSGALETIANVEERLSTDLPSRLMCTDGRGVGTAVRRFTEGARAGLRPIWLATGPAWTGIDLPDDVLGTLVITRLPFGITNPTLHEHRMTSAKSKESYRDAEIDMIKMFRQGLGRLVRSRTATHDRHLWVLDGRVTENGSGHQAASLLDAYPRCVSECL